MDREFIEELSEKYGILFFQLSSGTKYTGEVIKFGRSSFKIKDMFGEEVLINYDSVSYVNEGKKDRHGGKNGRKNNKN